MVSHFRWIFIDTATYLTCNRPPWHHGSFAWLQVFHTIGQCCCISQPHWCCWPKFQGGQFKWILGPLAVYCWQLDYHNCDTGLGLHEWCQYGMQAVSSSHSDVQGCSPDLPQTWYYLEYFSQWCIPQQYGGPTIQILDCSRQGALVLSFLSTPLLT